MSRRTRLSIIALMSLLTAALLYASPAPPRSLTGPVTRVVDGDTIEVELDGQRVRVRYIGINTPETKHPTKGREPCGKEAADANRRLVDGQTVRLELDVRHWDRYQRLLAYVYVGDIMVNAELVRQGYAQVATFPPNVTHQERFLELQRDARETRVGCWKMLAFPIAEFGLCSCGFLVSPLRKCFEFKRFAVDKAPVVLQTEDDLFHCQPAFAEDP